MLDLPLYPPEARCLGFSAPALGMELDSCGLLYVFFSGIDAPNLHLCQSTTISKAGGVGMFVLVTILPCPVPGYTAGKVGAAVEELILSMLNPNPEARPSARYIL